MTPTANPYVGPRPYEQDEGSKFFGRDREANELFSLISAHPVVLFYSQSGAGKTSLLNAAIIPRLKSQGDVVAGVARVGGKLPKETDEERLLNVFVFNALLSLQGKEQQFPPERLSKMSLAEYLESQDRGQQRQHFYPLNVVFFDQFEEFFTSFPKRLRQQESFFVNVSKALEADPLLRVVFAMREEYIAALDPFARMLPERFRWRFRLERLREEAALRAVEGPLEGTGRRFGPGVAKKLVNNLMQVPIKHMGGTVPTTGEYVEPVQLQIVCHGLWEMLPAKVQEIDERAVAEYGDVDNALANYYDDALGKVIETCAKMGRQVDEKLLRLWFEKSLITPIGTRGTVYMDVGRTEDELSEPVVKTLEEFRLIRPELRGGATWYELTHDRFIDPIRQSNREWFGSLPEDNQFALEMEQRAREWEQAGRRHEDLLTDEELRKIQQVWEHHANLKLEATEHLKTYVAESGREAERRRRKAQRKFYRIVALATLFALGLVAVTIFSSIKAWQASRVRKDAQIRRGDLAKEFSDVKGKEYDALVFGIEAVGMSDDPSLEAVTGLRKALAVIDGKVWLRGGAGIPTRLELSADGGLALTASGSEFFIWDAATGEKLSPYGHAAPRNGEWRKVAFSPDGSFLYAISAAIERDPSQSRVEQDAVSSGNGGDPRTVLVINARSGAPLTDLQERLKDARGMLVSEDGKYILVDVPGDVRIIETASQSVGPRFPEAQLQWRQIALSTDGSRVVAVYADSRVGVFASDSGRTVGGFDAGVSRARGRDFIDFSPDGHRVALARPSPNGGTAIIVWYDAAGKSTAQFVVKVGVVKHAAFSPGGDSVVVIGDAGAAVYDPSMGKAADRPLPQGTVANYSGTKALFIDNVGGKSTVFVWDALTDETRTLAQEDSAKYKFKGAAMTPDASRVITASEDNVIQVWTAGATPNVNDMTPAELMRNACLKLRDTKRGYELVTEQCKAYVPRP